MLYRLFVFVVTLDCVSKFIFWCGNKYIQLANTANKNKNNRHLENDSKHCLSKKLSSLRLLMLYALHFHSTARPPPCSAAPFWRFGDYDSYCLPISCELELFPCLTVFNVIHFCSNVDFCVSFYCFYVSLWSILFQCKLACAVVFVASLSCAQLKSARYNIE